MDALTFVAELTKAASWPFAMIIVAIIFKGQIRELLSRLKRGKMGPAEFEFEESVKELRNEARDAKLLEGDIGEPITSSSLLNPRSAVLNAWLDVEDAIADLARRADISHVGPSVAPLATLRALETAELIEPELASIVRGLRQLRNHAAHDQNFSPSEDTVWSYVQTARGASRTLREIQLR